MSSRADVNNRSSELDCVLGRILHASLSFFTYNFSSSVCSSLSLSPDALLTVCSPFLRECLFASPAKGLTKFISCVQQRQSMNMSSSSCSLVWGRGSLASWSRREDRVMPREEGLWFPRRSNTDRNSREKFCLSVYKKTVACCLYLSEEGSTTEGCFLLWHQGPPAPTAPAAQWAALWVYTPESPRTPSNCNAH